MQIARPPSGFFIIERPIATAALEAALPQCSWLLSAYANIKERLKMAGHTIAAIAQTMNAYCRGLAKPIIEADRASNRLLSTFQPSPAYSRRGRNTVPT